MDTQERKLTRESVSIVPNAIIKYVLKSEILPKAVKKRKVGEDKSPIPFPVWVIDGFARNFAQTYADRLEPSVVAFYISALTCLGSVLAGNVRMNTELKTDPRLYVLFIGESGKGKKSSAAKFTIDFFKDRVRAFRVCKGAGSAEGLFNEINAVKWDRRLLLFYDEFQQFVNKCKIESSVLLQMVNILFEDNSYESPLKKSKMKLDNAYLTMLSASTEETYDDCWTASFTNIGFNNRMFIVPIRSVREHSLPKAIDPVDKERLWGELEAILGMVGGEGMVYDITEDAYEYYDRWYLTMKETKHSVRIDTYALRLMPLLAANEMKTIIDIDIVKKVVAICGWQIKIRQRYEPVAVDNQYASMEAKIRKVLLERDMTRGEIQRATNGYRFGIKTLINAIGNLCTMGEVEYDSNSDTYRLVNENIRDTF
jgi:hypothetical protein